MKFSQSGTKIVGFLLIIVGLIFATITGYNHGSLQSSDKYLLVILGFTIAFLGFYFSFLRYRSKSHEEL